MLMMIIKPWETLCINKNLLLFELVAGVTLAVEFNADN